MEKKAIRDETNVFVFRWLSNLEGRGEEDKEEGSSDEGRDGVVDEHEPATDFRRRDLLKAKLNGQDSWVRMIFRTIFRW